MQPAQVADSLDELQIRWPTIPIVFCENRELAEEWTYRYLAAAAAWAATESLSGAEEHLDPAAALLVGPGADTDEAEPAGEDVPPVTG